MWEHDDLLGFTTPRVKTVSCKHPSQFTDWLSGPSLTHRTYGDKLLLTQECAHFTFQFYYQMEKFISSDCTVRLLTICWSSDCACFFFLALSDYDRITLLIRSHGKKVVIKQYLFFKQPNTSQAKVAHPCLQNRRCRVESPWLGPESTEVTV